MSAKPSFFAELQRRNVLRGGVLYAGAVWALAQGIAQLGPAIGLPDQSTRWFLVAAIVGFPFWIAFAWFYEFTSQGLKRESEIAADGSIAHSTGRKLDFAIIAVLALAVVLLLTDRFAWHRDDGGIPAKSVAVLPLVNESGDPQQDYFSDGLSEEMIAALGQVRDLKVIGRNSSFQFRGKAQDDTAGIGATLGVATLLEGTVRKQGGEVRIVASLIRAADGSQLWSQTYDRQLKDVFAMQAEIATSVANALKASVFGHPIEATDKPPSGNLQAYDAMLQGRYYAERRNRADYAKAVEYYHKAIALDPGYALAYARLAIAQQWFNDWEADADDRKVVGAQARANAYKAVQLAPQMALALGALGINQAWSDFNYPAAEANLKRAVALDPSNAEILYQLADVTACMGRLDEGIALMRKALAMEPLNASFHYYTGQFLLAQGRAAEAETEMERAIELQPDADGYRSTLALALMKRGRFDQAIALAMADPDEPERRWALTMIYFARGDKAQAQVELNEMIRLDGRTTAGQIADAYAFMGNADQAFVWLDRGIRMRDPVVASIYEQSWLVPELRNDPRFAAFCHKAGLPTPDEAEAASR